MSIATVTPTQDALTHTEVASARLDELAAQLKMIQAEIRELQAEHKSGDPHTDPDAATKKEPVSRRGLLHMSAAAVVGGVALAAGSSMLSPKPVRAAGNVILGVSNSAGTAETSVTSNNATYALQGYDLGSGSGIYGASNIGKGVEGFGLTGAGVHGVSNGDGTPSVLGYKYGHVTGPAVKGETINVANGYAAIYGITSGTGPGVFGEGLAAGNGTSGVAHGTGSGVYGQSDNGRGGRFAGKAAQLRLDPSTTTTHPASGLAGDIFLDKSKRLWLCKGGTTWVRIV